ncbi:DUF4307 domain-containing protein [Arthrobacter sulfonylureivorans]|uniref:DUF4307 domain-containing protein n=1 Tax=Arthrobacter sulfonylureivorans TaxID=2486855 RepID=A0ABY3W9N2_9MICC|nr:DUF4307 domain-containing protein [Arthrobacter sulfonylureivorans]UNK45032.1 DUF4307 domain-containing protein [Arthrobacter sulfonylureivorans]
MSTAGPRTPQTSSSLTVSNRYGTPRRSLSRRAKLALAGGALGVAVVGAGFFALGQNGPQIDTKDVGFAVADAGHMTVDFQVTKDPEATVQCAIKALSDNYAVVGWKVATIGPAGETTAGTTAHRVQLRTESLAVSGGVDSCWAADANS